MQELNYNYRSDVTYIATFELKLRAFQWKVTLFFIKIFEYNYWYVHVDDQQCFISTEEDIDLISTFTLQRFRKVIIQRLNMHNYACLLNIFFFILPQRSTCTFTKMAFAA